MESLSISTFNIWGSVFAGGNFTKRAREICRYFDKSGTDIIHFQEVFTYPKLRFFQKNLPSYPYCRYQKSILGPRGGVATFSKVKIEKALFHEFDNKLIKGNFNPGIAATGKGVLVSWLNDSHVTLINTHLSPTYVSPSYKTDPRKMGEYDKLTKSQLRELQNLIDKESKNRAVIITGDFNLAKDTEIYKFFLDQGIVDIFADYSSPTYHQKYAPDKKTAYRIDYIFLKPKGKYTVINKSHLFTDNPLSDHIGLAAKIKLDN